MNGDEPRARRLGHVPRVDSLELASRFPLAIDVDETWRAALTPFR